MIRALILLLALGARPAAAEEPEAEPEPEAPPGRFHVGPLWITPTLRVHSLGIDTNVFYTPSERQVDGTAALGPGLELVLPIRDQARLTVAGGVDYLFFVRTDSQRKLTASGRARLAGKWERTEAAAEETLGSSFERPSFEVDQRVWLFREATRAELKRRLLGKIRLNLAAARSQARADPGEDYLGTDLGRTLSQDQYRVAAGLEYAMTVKTSAVLEWEHLWDRFPRDATRDADSDRLLAGLRTDATALVSGHALVGLRRFEPREGDGSRDLLLVDVDATLNLSPKTHVGVLYLRDLAYSLLTVTGGTPTLRIENLGLHLEKELFGPVDLRLRAQRSRLVTDGKLRVVGAIGTLEAERDDTTWQASADLGVRIRQRLRLGLVATYTDRQSTIADFGISGLLLGASLSYTP